MRAVVAVYVIPVPLGLTKASAYSNSASQFRLSASANCANGELYSRAAQPSDKCSGATEPKKATCSIKYTTVLNAIEPKIAKGTLRPGWRASPARFTGLWKPL